MKRILILFSVSLVLFACSAQIDGTKVNEDKQSHVYTYKDGGANVTGTVVFYDSQKLKTVIVVKDGKRVGTAHTYYPSGKLGAEWSFDSNGLGSGIEKDYWENGTLSATWEYKENRLNGIAKNYNEKGVQIKETVYENDKKIREYEFDSSGNKIIPNVEKVELVAGETGFYPYRDLQHLQFLLVPIVILKLKNVSNEPISGAVLVQSVFTSKGEEWSSEESIFQSGSLPPLQPGVVRQVSIQSGKGYLNEIAIPKADISCQVSIDKQPLKEFKISNKILSSNQMQ
ncbi:MAG: hypothetical protein ABSB63_02200 [Spirochaetia bacterium]|jgi:hypothetical protein